VKHAIWLVNIRAGSSYPVRGIKMPSRDFRGILKMSLFYCSYFIKQLPNGFPSRIAWSMHLWCRSTFGKRKNTLACGSSIFTHSESLPTSLVHGSRNPTVVGCYAFCSRKRGLRFFQRCWCECEMASCYFIIGKVMYLALNVLLLEQYFGYILTGLYTSIFKRNYCDNFI
jgi:hypothetical protein